VQLHNTPGDGQTKRQSHFLITPINFKKHFYRKDAKDAKFNKYVAMQY